jgi:predicted aldo/keto reductase-like oxidoreductase
MATRLVTEFRQLRWHVRFLWAMAAVQAVLVGIQVAQQIAD